MSLAKKTLAIYWQHAWRYPRYVIGLILIMPLTLLIHQFLPPLIAANVLSRLSSGAFDRGDLWGSFGTDLLLYAGLVLFGGAVAWRIAIVLVWKLESAVIRDMNQRIFKHFMGMSAGFHANSFGGSLVSQTNKFTGAYIRVADTTIFQVYTLVLALLFTAVILRSKAPQFVILLFILTGLYVVSAVAITRHVRKLNAEEAKAQNKQTGYLADMLTNILAVKSFAATKQEIARFAHATEETRAATLNVMRAATKRDIYFAGVTSGIDVLALTMAAASVVLFDADIALVFLVLTYASNIVHRLWEFSQNTLRNYNRAIGDARDGTQMLLMEPEVTDPALPEDSRVSRGSIEFRGVSFNHEVTDNSNGLFRDLNLRIKPGEKIGLVGHSGSGKTTLTKLLLRFADIDEGQILIDGQDISHLTQEDLRRHIAYVPQEPLLFHRTLKENISYAAPDAGEKSVEAVAKMANAHEFISKLPNGYNTLVGERGVKLSGGQRQRVAIARAMLKNAPILVLDEATSALDSESEVLIQDALWKLMEGRTAIVIAHRLSTIQRMDRIIVLDHGKIIEEGTHKELIRKNGKYAELWAHQSGGFLEES